MFDEIDSLMVKRKGNDSETTHRVKNELLKEMDGSFGKQDKVRFIQFNIILVHNPSILKELS